MVVAVAGRRSARVARGRLERESIVARARARSERRVEREEKKEEEEGHRERRKATRGQLLWSKWGVSKEISKVQISLSLLLTISLRACLSLSFLPHSLHSLPCCPD